MEIKQKIVKYVPLNTQMAVKRVCKQWHDIVTDLNNLQTKLVYLDEIGTAFKYQPFQLPFDVNMVCNIASHSFDQTLVIHFQSDQDGKSLAKNFPNLVAVYFSCNLDWLAAQVAPMLCNLKHIRAFGDEFTNVERFNGMKWTCLQYSLPHKYSTAPVPLVKLRYFTGTTWSYGTPEEMLRRGLVGIFMENRECANLLTQYAMNIEIFYDVDVQDDGWLSQFPNLTTVYGLKAMGRFETPMTIRQLIHIQFEITKRKQTSQKRNLHARCFAVHSIYIVKCVFINMNGCQDSKLQRQTFLDAIINARGI